MSRVKVGGRQEYEWLTNYKILQTALDKNRVDKVRRSDAGRGESHS